MNMYFINTGNNPEYIKADYAQIQNGKLELRMNLDNSLVKSFVIDDYLYFDTLTRIKS